MNDLPAPGLTADWLNGWLAAVGVTVLVPGARLAWTRDPRPVARFRVEGSLDIVADIARALPSAEDLKFLAIARVRPGHADFPRSVSLDCYQDRARLAREAQDFSLGATVTDLQASFESGDLPHSPFDPPAPQGRTLYQRLVACREALGTDVQAWVDASFAGKARRITANGLGFDYRRFVSGVQPEASKSVDPVVECLAFFGLALFPVRGDGRRQRTRGWRTEPSKDGAFTWAAWLPALDRWAIDALVDLLPDARSHPSIRPRLGISGLFETVAYHWVGSQDTTRAYASRRVR
jgi:hypothetical protein